MYSMSKRNELLDATKKLLWEKGYDATSPRDIQALSEAGQGSFYHHFKSKKELAVQAMDEVATDRIADFEQAFGRPGSVKDRIIGFLEQPREPLKGCRIGRMVWDSAIQDPDLQKPLARYFDHVVERIETALEAAAQDGQVELRLPPRQIALAAITAIQGGFTVSRALQNPTYMAETITGVKSLLDFAIVDR
jgi:AcrR family transcriptional regulator